MVYVSLLLLSVLITINASWSSTNRLLSNAVLCLWISVQRIIHTVRWRLRFFTYDNYKSVHTVQKRLTAYFAPKKIIDSFLHYHINWNTETTTFFSCKRSHNEHTSNWLSSRVNTVVVNRWTHSELQKTTTHAVTVVQCERILDLIGPENRPRN